MVDGPAASSLSNGHDGEEARETEGSEDQLVESHPLHGRDEGARLGDGEAPTEEAEPLELERGHAEAVGHESRESLKVEWRREVLRLGDQISVEEGLLAVQLVYLEGDRIVLRIRRLTRGQLAEGSLADGGYGLGDGICDASEDGVGHHHCEDCRCSGG